jgi:hypothetical protein
MKENPFNFDYVMFKYIYTIKDNISEETFTEVSSYKLLEFIKYMEGLSMYLNTNQKMIFMDEMFSFNRFSLDSLNYDGTDLNIWGTLDDSVATFYYPNSHVQFNDIEIISILNGYKEKVSLDSVKKLPLILQGVEPHYDVESQVHGAKIYVSVDIYNPKYNEIIMRDPLSNICEINFTYTDIQTVLGERNMREDPYTEEDGELLD